MATPPSSPSMETKTSSIWGGRFSRSPDELLQEINVSLDVDKRMVNEDIEASLAHAEMLRTCGILSPEDYQAICQGMHTIIVEIAEGRFPFRRDLEDIHMNIESRLKTLIGDAAGRLHTARSRNDQVVTDFRMVLRRACETLVDLLRDLQRQLHQKATNHTETLMPGYTHLQIAQPVSLAHHLLAYVEMFGRDRLRFTDCARRLNECPLGAAALAGTSFPIDRYKTAEALGFDRPMANSMDAVSARDFVQEFLAAATIAATHLSRLGEELVLWASPHFAFVDLGDTFSTGSSIMPQKRNPDAAELLRAKIGGLLGAFTHITTILKGLPLTYSKDLQDDKDITFRAIDTLSLGLRVAAAMIQDMKAKPETMAAWAQRGFSTATDLADYLVQTFGLPFRDAHHITGRVVHIAEINGCDLADLTLDTLQGIYPPITSDVYTVLSAKTSLHRRISLGGTAPARVWEALAEAEMRWLA
jgi:argininosuccinate lyase